MTKDMALGLTRHVLTAGGGFVIGKGWIDAASFEAVVGALVTLAGVGWSVYEKKARR